MNNFISTYTELLIGDLIGADKIKPIVSLRSTC